MAIERPSRRHMLHKNAWLILGENITTSPNHNGITCETLYLGRESNCRTITGFQRRTIPKSDSDVSALFVVEEYKEFCFGEPLRRGASFPKDPLSNRRNVLSYSPGLAIRSKYGKT